MLFKGILRVSLFLKGTQVTKFCLLNSSFLISANRTFTITEPSLRWRLTFLPRKDLAVFRPNFSIFSPLHIFISQSTPASPANWQSLSSEKDVNLNVTAFTFSVPRIFTTLHQREPPLTRRNPNPRHFLLLKLSLKQHHRNRERRVKVRAFSEIIHGCEVRGCFSHKANQSCCSSRY